MIEWHDTNKVPEYLNGGERWSKKLIIRYAPFDDVARCCEGAALLNIKGKVHDWFIRNDENYLGALQSIGTEFIHSWAYAPSTNEVVNLLEGKMNATIVVDGKSIAEEMRIIARKAMDDLINEPAGVARKKFEGPKPSGPVGGKRDKFQGILERMLQPKKYKIETRDKTMEF